MPLIRWLDGGVSQVAFEDNNGDEKVEGKSGFLTKLLSIFKKKGKK